MFVHIYVYVHIYICLLKTKNGQSHARCQEKNKTADGCLAKAFSYIPTACS